MIRPGEIQSRAGAAGVRDQQIEKDYILSWILCGIAKHPHLARVLAFKGGTVLKKVYFRDYRFSEDLDFTLLDNDLSDVKIFEWFREVFVYIKEEANIALEIIDNTIHAGGSINCYIKYVGPLGGSGTHKKVKVDISRSEQVVFDPVMAQVLIDYSDLEAYQLLCYQLEEVLAEKLRSVMQRMQARDFYDLWYLLEHHGMDAAFYINEFQSKCESKGLMHTDFPKKLTERIPQYKSAWQGSLQDQIKDLSEFDRVEREVLRNLRKFIDLLTQNRK